MNEPATTESPWGAPHPLLDREFPPLTREQAAKVVREHGAEGLATLEQYVKDRTRRRALAESDPLRHGWELPHWKDVRHLIQQKEVCFLLGANNSAKSFFLGKLVCEVLTRRFTWPELPSLGLRVLCIAQNDSASKMYQQPAVYLHLPAGIKRLNEGGTRKRNSVTKIAYSMAGGFTEGTFVLPRPLRSQCWFKTVEQYLRDPNSFEGPAFHLVVIDEGCPLPLLETLLFRAAKVGGKVVYAHTAIHGYDSVTSNVLEGAKLTRSLPMNQDWLLGPAGGANPEIVFPELKPGEVQSEGLRKLGCPAGQMPYVLQPLNFSRGVIYTWCHWNPFQPRGRWNPKLPALFDKCVGLPKWKVLVRLFGWIEKLSGCRIGNFNPTVHVIPHERIAKLLAEGKLTSIMADDPAIAKSHFLAWLGVDKDGNHYIFDESPRYETEGEWVDAQGEPGEGQKVYASMGANWYKKHIRDREREHGQPALFRWGDPRAFATKAAEASGARNLFELFQDDNSAMDPDYAPLYFQPAQIRQTIDLDLDGVVTKLAYDTQRAEREGGITVENQPKLFVSDRCQNIIRCWLNWDGTPDSPYKDGVDAAARYLFCVPSYYVDPHVPDVVGGRGWG